MERQEQDELQAKLDEEAAISAELTFVECTVGTISHPPKNVGKDKNWKPNKMIFCFVMMLIRWLIMVMNVIVVTSKVAVVAVVVVAAAPAELFKFFGWSR